MYQRLSHPAVTSHFIIANILITLLENMDPITNHLILVTAEDYENASKQVEHFFDTTLLVRYDRILIKKEKCYSGKDKAFHATLMDSIEENKKTVHKLFRELESTGFKAATDLLKIEYGYPSKLLHIITHFLDGFIGIDTVFYNLIEDSHWVSEATRKRIRSTPENFWLIYLDCYSATPEEAALVKH